MAGGKIYLREEDGLVPMIEEGYLREDDLQALLADYPDLLAGDQMRPSEPRRWLLIAREAGVPDAEGGQPRWSLDHLFIDQDAVPTLVEVKRSTNTQIRREIVGQMLDYAANVVAHWPSAQLRQLFEDRPRADGASPDEEVIRFLELPELPEDEAAHAVDEFWERASSNLAARKLRLLFVADVIPPELQRIVEFLNENLVRAEVLAVEVKQYVGEGRQTLVPRVIGRTAAAEDVKRLSGGTSRVGRIWSEPEFLEAALATGGPSAERLARDTMEWNRRHGVEVAFGTGKHGPLYLQARAATGELLKIASVRTSRYAIINYGLFHRIPPFDRAEERVEINRRLNRIPGVKIPERSAVEGLGPTIHPEALAPEAAQGQFLEVFDWVAARLADPSN